MALNFIQQEAADLRPRITVFGVGGAGGNAVNNMIEKALEGAEFVVANTDAQALQQGRAPRKLQLGANVTQGLGAGAKPGVGAQAAEESLEEIVDHLAGSHMCFITAGMGGGTGTGAAPVIARAAREMGILTVGVVTKPFHFEGTKRMRQADGGIEELQQVVDTLIIIPNQNLFRIANERTTFGEAFMMADDVLYQGVKGVTDLMVRPGLINLDFADVRSVMDEMGKAMMGTGEASGETRAIDAAEKAIANPLLDEVSLKGARGVLINITGGYDLTLFELDEAANRIRAEVDPEANIIVGSTLEPEMSDMMRVSVVATGIDAAAVAARPDMAAHAPVAPPRAAAPEAPQSAPAPRPRIVDPAADAPYGAHVEANPAPHPEPRFEPRHGSRAAAAPNPTPVQTTAQAAPTAEAARRAETQESLFTLDAADHDDDPLGAEGIFELDDGSLDGRAVDPRRAPAPEPAADNPFVAAARRTQPTAAAVRAARAAPVAPAAPSVAAPRAAAPAQQQPPERAAERPSRFGFNNLITRMTGGGRDPERPSFLPNPDAAPRREPRAEPEPALRRGATPAAAHREDDEDAQMEVPAFLRRQAN